MKTKILTLLVTLAVILFTSCNNDDDVTPVEPINGTWNLTNILGGFAGIDDDYASGVITWTFNTQNMTLHVENNNTQETIFSGFETGTYPYTLVESNGNEYVHIDGEEFGGYVINSDGMIINQNEIQDGVLVDGFILHFER